MQDAASKFNIAMVRELFVFADAKHSAALLKILKPYPFLSPQEGREFSKARDSQNFAIAACDFTNSRSMQVVAKIFSEMNGALTHRIIYAVAPETLQTEHSLFAQEIGARYVAGGLTRTDDLRSYLKRICIEAHNVGPLENYEAELAQGCHLHDRQLLQSLIERLRALPAATEEVCRMLAVAYSQLPDEKRAEFYLKQILTLNDQNLWAANTLGKLYLRRGRMAEGIEVLRKISHFHNLNGERLLTLGEACVGAGLNQEAQEAFAAGEALNQGQDARFKEGLAKVRLSTNDYDGALALLGEKGLSREILSFLNMRAILAIRQNQPARSLMFYQQALKGSASDTAVQARLLFNIGLAYVRLGNLDQAEKSFEDSIKLGGPSFKRAIKPLSAVRKIKSAQKRSEAVPTPLQQIDLITQEDELAEWEALY